MSTKKTLKNNAAIHAPKKGAVIRDLIINRENEKALLKQLSIIIAIIAFAVYANTFVHGYVLDDFSIIKGNTMTQKGISALKDIFTHSYRIGYNNDDSGLYRPLSKAMFALEWEIAPNTPGLGHFVNVLLYSLSCVLLFRVLCNYIKINALVLFIGVLLFAAHPIHTEVVANIKSRDEILSMLFILLSLHAMYKYTLSESKISLVLSFFCFFLSLLSKESSITYLALVPLVLHFFSTIPLNKKILVTAGMAVATAIYIMIHIKVVGSVGLKNVAVVDNSLFETTNTAHQKATAIYIMGKYLWLLIFPHPLSCDYSFRTIPLVTSFGNGLFLIALAVHVFLLVYAIMKLKEKHILSFCIFFYFISMSIASNIFTLIGTNMAERLLYLPSVGFTIAAGYLLAKQFKVNLNGSYENVKTMLKNNTTLFSILTVVLVLYSVKTLSRNKDWNSDTTLFSKDVVTTPNSAHMLFYYANHMTNSDTLATLQQPQREQRLRSAQKEILKALTIYEPFPDAHNIAGKIFYEFKDYDNARKSYERAMILSPENSVFHNNYGTCAFSTGQYQEAKKAFAKAVELNPEYADALCNLGSVYGAIGESYKQQGNIVEANNHFLKAIEYFKRTTEVDRYYKGAYNFIALTYVNLGNKEAAQPWFDKYNKLLQESKKK